jgi:hypothetical protein
VSATAKVMVWVRVLVRVLGSALELWWLVHELEEQSAAVLGQVWSGRV